MRKRHIYIHIQGTAGIWRQRLVLGFACPVDALLLANKLSSLLLMQGQDGKSWRHNTYGRQDCCMKSNLKSGQHLEVDSGVQPRMTYRQYSWMEMSCSYFLFVYIGQVNLNKNGRQVFHPTLGSPPLMQGLVVQMQCIHAIPAPTPMIWHARISQQQIILFLM